MIAGDMWTKSKLLDFMQSGNITSPALAAHLGISTHTVENWRRTKWADGKPIPHKYWAKLDVLTASVYAGA